VRLVARVKELVVEGSASFTAQQFQAKLEELLSEQELGASEPGQLVQVALKELVVHSGPGLSTAARATARALTERLRKADP
jgi:D-alanyl-D-alanine carboxypeptidase